MRRGLQKILNIAGKLLRPRKCGTIKQSKILCSWMHHHPEFPFQGMKNQSDFCIVIRDSDNINESIDSNLVAVIVYKRYN